MTQETGFTLTKRWLTILAVLISLPRIASAGLTPSAESLLNDGVTSLYNLDYEKSRASFHKIIETEPENPFGYLFESAGIWWQSSQEYGLFKDTPTLQGLFERDIDTAIKKAAPMLKSKDASVRADGLFASGMALGTLGQWSLMRGHWLKACNAGRKAMKDLKQCVKTDSNYDDALLGLGVYDYQAAHLSSFLKFSAMLCGAHGNEKHGLELIRQAMEKGRYGSRQAREFLFSIYLSDRHEPKEAMEVLQKLRQDFPVSPYFEFLEIALRHRLGDTDGSIKEGKEFFALYQGDLGALDRKLLTLICGMEGADCLNKEDVARANAWFTQALDADKTATPPSFNSDAWLSVNHILRGYSWDILNKRADAAKDYEWVLAHPDLSDLHARAKECLANPCTVKPVLTYLRGLSQTSNPAPEISSAPVRSK